MWKNMSKKPTSEKRLKSLVSAFFILFDVKIKKKELSETEIVGISFSTLFDIQNGKKNK